MVRKAEFQRALALAGLLWTSPALAGAELGIGVDASRDLKDAKVGQSVPGMGTGLSLRAPARWRLKDSLAVRADLGLGLAFGNDRVEWRAYETMVPVYSDTHSTTLSTLGIALGPELSPWASTAVSPYFGVMGGYMWARHWHRFDGMAEQLLGLAGGGQGVHPYTDQVVPMVQMHIGGRTEIGNGLAIEVEAGYNVAFMREAQLAQTPDELDAVRVAYGLNQLKLGLNLVIPLSKGSES